jgi:Zn-dependent M28 family amino/carboxypeptidase
MLELARLTGQTRPLAGRIDFVAFTLEEREFPREVLRTRHLGSYTYAKSLAGSGVKVRWMMALEMIGYFTEEPRSQKYPLFLKWFYPDTGNYIAVVGKCGQGGLVAAVKEGMAAACCVPVVSTTAPQFLPGIDFSDHEPFWRFGYNAVMITDTAFYRNPNYHRATDTAGTLDYTKMAEVVKGLYGVVATVE